MIDEKKLIERLVEERDRICKSKNDCIALCDHEANAITFTDFNKAISIVNQLAEESVTGDLISRSALLEKLNDTGVQITFDLPVEEILGEDIDIDDFSMLVQDAVQAYRKMIIDTIHNQPTAYNDDL